MTLAALDNNQDDQLTISEEARLVQLALVEAGLETPMINNDLTAEEKKVRISHAMAEIARTLGLDLNDDSLRDTPDRIAKMYVDEIFSGLDYTTFPKITAIKNKMRVEEMVKVSDITLTSTCEHHFVTIDGLATVAYIPKNRIIGLSKINRLVRFFAQRPQVQERLTQQVLVSLQALLDTDNVAITINATHYCVKARGVMDVNSATRTTALGGVFKSSSTTRAEFLAQ